MQDSPTSILQQFETFSDNLSQHRRAGTLTADLVASSYTAMCDIFQAQQGEQGANPPILLATMADLVTQYYTTIESWKGGAPTGVPGLDEALGGGLLPGRLVALLGAPGKGKTALAAQIAETVAHAGRAVVYTTSEDSPHMLLCRSLSRLYDLDYGAVLKGLYRQQVTADTLQKYVTQRRSAANMLTIDYSSAPFRLDAMAEQARQHFDRVASGQPGIIVVDYLQRLARASGVGGVDLRQQVTNFTEELRRVAVRLQCTILMLSASGRDSYKNGASDRSQIGAAKESGDIEYTCDVLMSIVDDASDRAPIDACVLRLDKNRQGPPAAIPLLFLKTRQTFAPREVH